MRFRHVYGQPHLWIVLARAGELRVMFLMVERWGFRFDLFGAFPF